MKTDALRVLSILAQASSAAMAMPIDVQIYPLESSPKPKKREEDRQPEKITLTDTPKLTPVRSIS